MRGSGGGLSRLITSPQNGDRGHEWSGGASTPGSVSSGHFNDALTVDSWNTTMTAMLQPHKNQKNSFQCPTHLAFVTKDPLDVCPHCERQQQLTLQERRKLVDQQLRDMDMPNSSSRDVTKDILGDLQSTMKQWKIQPPPPATPDGTTASTSTSTPNADNTRSHLQSNQNNQDQNQFRGSNNNQQQQQQQNQGNQNQYNNNGIHHPYSNGTSHSQQHQPSHQQQNPYSGGMGGMQQMPPQMQQMMPPPPPMAPSFNGANFGVGNPQQQQQQQQGSGNPLEALALQIQGMQRMQDWMLYQKEQECQTLRQRLDSATQQINTLAVENALLQEKLHQQEQRMKHELKLIKLAAMQQQQQRGGSVASHANKSSSSSQHSGDPNSSALVAAAGVAAPRSSNNSVASGNSQGGPPSSMANDSFGMFPSSDAMGQPKTSVVTTSLSRQDHDNFFNRYQNPHHASMVAPGNQPPPQHQQQQQQQYGSNPQQQQSRQQDAFGRQQNDTSMSVKSANSNSGNQQSDPLKLMNSLSLSPESKDEGDEEEEPPLSHHKRMDSGPVDLDDVDEQLSASKKRQGNSVPSSPQKSQTTTNPSTEDEYSYNQSVPRDIQIAPSVTSESTEGTRNTASQSKPIPALKPPPEKGVVKSVKPQQQQQWQQEQAPPPPEMTGPPPPILVNAVNFPDSSDNMSIGNTVASSTYGEDRQQVNSQVILDPYGDRGTYTGVILRSTGMPHGSGRMIYQEDNRTYDGEWRHGRWHGYGRATFANGDNYHGEYRFDQRHGRGRYEWNDGRVYDGMFREDKRHGRGIFTWPDGAVYEGDFRNGQREGHGTYRFSDGGRYEGSWKDGRYNGFGICNWEDGRCYKGEWMNGMAHGKGVETFADGAIRHDGQWIEDEPVVS